MRKCKDGVLELLRHIYKLWAIMNGTPPLKYSAIPATDGAQVTPDGYFYFIDHVGLFDSLDHRGETGA